ncbi:MAG: S-layer homology domain-containing protein [Clostridiales Family XIII bacterium]|nr:S-layer homology domain-containing protein [Clostridiales Family XIII bacterium]
MKRILTLTAAFLLTLTMVVMPLTTSAVTVEIFPDVPDKHWASGYIQWGVSSETVKGFEDGTFRPEESLSRAEFAALILSSQEKLGLHYP